jgi:hypothetical protein
MLVDEFFQSFDILLRLVYRSGWDGVSRHWDRQLVPDCVLEPDDQVSGQTHGCLLTTPGKIFFNLSAAQTAFTFPPSTQSSKSKSGWRTGFEKETRAESTKVMFRTPHP